MTTTHDAEVLPDGWRMNSCGDGGATKVLSNGSVTVHACPGQSVAVSTRAADAVDGDAVRAARRRLGGPTNTDICRAIEQEYPGWHVWLDVSGHPHASDGSVILDAPALGMVAHVIACHLHAGHVASLRAGGAA